MNPAPGLFGTTEANPILYSLSNVRIAFTLLVTTTKAPDTHTHTHHGERDMYSKIEFEPSTEFAMRSVLNLLINLILLKNSKMI